MGLIIAAPLCLVPDTGRYFNNMINLTKISQNVQFEIFDYITKSHEEKA